jgi:hypothetical protein
MASSTEVKKYLAYWFQLGKKMIIPSRNISLSPSKIISANRYSVEFEDCWTLVADEKTGDCYLEGTIQSIQELLSPKWEISSCARCEMPVPIIQLGVQNGDCVCSDVEGWPNNDLPKPRTPVNNKGKLIEIQKSLAKNSLKPEIKSLKISNLSQKNTISYDKREQGTVNRQES